MAIVYKIHPAIGAARVGNSAEYYLAPETPGGLPLDSNNGQPIYTGPGVPPQNIYHDASGALKKQGARFKVFAYDNSNPADLGTRVQAGTTKVNGKTVTAIEWTVYLANKKASWFEFQQLTGSGMEGDLGYIQNNANNPDKKKSEPYNPLRSSVALGISSDPNTLNDPKRRQLILDPGPRTVSGPKAPAQEFAIASKSLQPFNVTTLGRIFTDAECNLIVLAGDGCSGTTDLPPTITVYANNSGWFDDVSDGPVTGVLVLEDGSKVPIDTPSWVLCGPPKYAPEVTNLVTMYDTMYDVFVQHLGLNPGLFHNGFQARYKPSHVSEIVPLLSRPNLYRYVAATGRGVRPHAALPTQNPSQFSGSLRMVRVAGQTNANKDAMPLLAGDNPSISAFQVSNFLTLTATQYFVLSQYARGHFSQSAAPASGEGVALDRANLENCVGGAFCPGIEMTWISRNTTIYMPLPPKPAMSDAFRIKHKNLSGGLTLTNGADNDYSAGLEPGDIIKYMAQPWQADFNECSAQPIPNDPAAPPPPPPPSYWWWPAQRPFSVFPVDDQSKQVFWTRTSKNPAGYEFDDDLQMVTNWKDMGFILNIGPAASPNFVEIERNDKAIDDYGEPLIA
jgi:hypothetical protein